MKVIGVNGREVKRMVNRIQKQNGDCESLLNKKEWYGVQMSCTLLFASYGAIGYSIEYNGHDIKVDNELDEITIDDEDYEALAYELDGQGTIDTIPERIKALTGVVPDFVDEKIDDGCCEGEVNNYVMMRSYKVERTDVRVYYGDVDRKVGYVTVTD